MKAVLIGVAAIVVVTALVPTGGNSEMIEFLKYAFYIGVAIWIARDFMGAGK